MCQELMEDKVTILDIVKRAALQEIQTAMAREASDGKFYNVQL
jgi:hypothetical protein